MSAVLARLQGVVLPGWSKVFAIAALAAAAYGVGRLQEARRGVDAMVDYVGKQATQTVRIAKAQAQVVTKVEIQYRDRIQIIYKEGKQIEESIPEIVTPDVDRRLPLPAGFVRILDAGWTGQLVGSATDSDGEPADVPASVVAANEVDNATSCRAWRKQVFGWRQFYAGQQVAINGKAGVWAERAGVLEASKK
ncbi:hypothetical protein [Massilia aerilata]|uniref:Uncharacterized protein n=1 Tax=Massilia aerilata TaxID=453817 RepID=A0ABW0S435_9BURK